MFRIESLYRAGFALGALSLLVFFLGHLGLISAPFLVSALIISLAIFFASFKRSDSSAPFKPLSNPEAALLILSLAAVLAIIPLALLPPTVRDEVIQHLALPKLYMQKGRIFEISSFGFSYLPQNIDLLYLIPLALGNDIMPRLIHLGFGALTGLLVYFYISDKAGRAYGLLGFLLYISTPLVFNLSRMAYTDNAAALYSTLALFAALRWKEGFELKWLMLSAASAGFALGVKYNGAITLALIGAFILFCGARRQGLAKALRAGALYIFIALLILSPWLVRNLVWGKSPFYPVYETAALSSVRGEGFHVTGEMAPVGKRYLLYKETTLDIVLLPLRVFWEGADNSIEKFDGVLNPLLLLFIPLAFIKKRGGDLKYLALFSLLFFFMAASIVDLATRYLMPIMPTVIVIAVFGAKFLLEGRLKFAAIALLAALLLFNGSYALGLYSRYRPFAYLQGAESRDDYLLRTLPDYKAVRYANLNLPKDAKVLLLFSGDRGFYWEREYSYWDRTGVMFKDYLKTHNDEEKFRNVFSLHGFTHIFINERIMEDFVNNNFSADELKTLAAFFEKHTEKVFSANGFSVFELE